MKELASFASCLGAVMQNSSTTSCVRQKGECNSQPTWKMQITQTVTLSVDSWSPVVKMKEHITKTIKGHWLNSL